MKRSMRKSSSALLGWTSIKLDPENSCQIQAHNQLYFSPIWCEKRYTTLVEGGNHVSFDTPVVAKLIIRFHRFPWNPKVHCHFHKKSTTHRSCPVSFGSLQYYPPTYANIYKSGSSLHVFRLKLHTRSPDSHASFIYLATHVQDLTTAKAESVNSPYVGSTGVFTVEINTVLKITVASLRVALLSYWRT